MRERFLEAFDEIWIDNLNGDKYRTGKVTPDGKPDPSVFSTEKNREGIQVGTAIGTARAQDGSRGRGGPLSGFVGRGEAQQLCVESRPTESRLASTRASTRCSRLGLPFRPSSVDPRLPRVAAAPRALPSVVPRREDQRVTTSWSTSIEMRSERECSAYFDPDVSDAEIATRSALGDDGTQDRFDRRSRRATAASPARRSSRAQIIAYAYRPFDIRWLYWEPDTKLLDEKRADYVRSGSTTATAFSMLGRGARKSA